MKNTNIILLTAVIASLFFFNSCNSLVYSPNDEYYVDIQQPTANLSINLDNAEDTIYVRGNTEFNYTVDVKDKQFASVVFYLNSEEIDYTSNRNTFLFHSNNYNDGTYNFRLEVLAFSGSGSLADKLHSEYLVSAQNWTVIIDNQTVYDDFDIDSVKAVNGNLKISWKKYPFYNFEQYRIYKAKVSDNGITQSYNQIGTIFNKQINYFLDTTYVGGKFKYKVEAKTYGNIYKSIEKLYSDNSMLLLPLNILDNERVEVKWNKNKYYSNFKYYYLEKATTFNAVNGWYDQVGIFNNINDTSFVDTMGFGYEMVYRLTTKSGQYNYYFSNTVTGYTGQQLNEIYEITRIQHIPILNSIYLNGQYRYDANTLKLLNSGTSHIEVSKKGTYAFTNEENNYYPPHTFTSVDPVTLQNGTSFHTDLLMHYYSTNPKFLVSETGNCFYLSYRYKDPTTYGPPAKVFIKTNPPQVIYKDSSYDYSERILISNLSNEGEYLFIWPNVFKLNGNSVTKLYTVNTILYLQRITFSQTGTEYLLSENQSIEIFNCSNNSLVKSINIGVDLNNIMIDESTGYLGGNVNNANTYRIYDLNNGNLVMQIKLAYDSSNEPGTCYLVNSHLFAYNGHYINLTF